MGYELKQTGTGLQFWEDASSAQAAAVLALTWTVNRGATNTQTVGTLPANARILRIDTTTVVVSNAATTANVSVGISGGSNTFFSAAADVKSALANTSATPTANWATSTSAQTLTCTYTETGTASTSGTAYVTVYYAAN